MECIHIKAISVPGEVYDKHGDKGSQSAPEKDDGDEGGTEKTVPQMSTTIPISVLFVPVERDKGNFPWNGNQLVVLSID